MSGIRPLVEALESRTAPAAAVFDASHLLVRFAPGATPAAALAPGMTLGDSYSLVPGLHEVRLSSAISLEQALTALRANPNVLYAEPDYELHTAIIPNDPGFGNLYGLHNTGQSGGTVDADIDAPEGWNTTTGTGNTIVAVIDTGVDYNHPDLAANIWTNSGETAGNGIDDDGNGYIDDVHGYDWVNNDGNPMDDNSHGTHVAGTIGAVGNNGIGVVGVAWNVKIMALKFLSASGSGSTGNAVKALNYAVSKGASLSNNSWGGGGYSQSLYDAILSARNQGHIFVAAAGNSGVDIDSSPFYPASYNLANVVAVAATDRYDLLASYSNYGDATVDLAAPGSSIYSTIPGNSYGTKSGTSMATPHVAGALALVRDLNPTWTYTQVISQITSTVDVLPSLQGKTITGGRLNLANALGGGSGAPTLSINDRSVTEGNTGTKIVSFTVTLSAVSTDTVTVNWVTADGTAKAGTDYVAASGALTFNPGVTSQPIDITINGDTAPEANETFFVNLSGATNASIADGQGMGTIQNDDQPSASINDVSTTEGNNGKKKLNFTVSLSAPASATVTINYATANGTATAPDDYRAASGTVSISAGSSTATISVTINSDRTAEANETFFVNLSNPVNVTLADNQGQGTITNDDGAAASSADSQIALLLVALTSEVDGVTAEATPVLLADGDDAHAAAVAAVLASGDPLSTTEPISPSAIPLRDRDSDQQSSALLADPLLVAIRAVLSSLG